VGEVEIFYQLLVGSCLFERVQVLAMQILDESPLEAGNVVSSLHHGRNRLQTRSSSGTAAALAGDQLKAVVDLPHENRLDHSDALDGVNERGKGFLIEIGPGLMLVWLDLRKWNISKDRSRFTGRGSWYQCSKPASQSTSLN
jgi:hypothetical protein